MKKKVSVSILGTGYRGADAYEKGMAEMLDKFEIVSLCDLDYKN